MKPLLEHIRERNALLAPYAARHESRGRIRDEAFDDTRMPFQRDRARIIHSKAFRRLAGKTQVFVAGEDDHYRTRLTHTMEVAQITRDLARALGLNEDLAECIALAHDLGHAPFGHNGQDALHEWMHEHGSSFEHNIQSHRIVTMLEIRDNNNGLNLTRDVVDGLFKHGGNDERGEPVHFCLEAQLANACDEIAYTAHDTDDGLEAGLFTYDELQTIPFAMHAAETARQRGTFIRSTLIDILARDLLLHAQETLVNDAIPTIGVSPALRTALRPLRTFLWERMYHHPMILARMEHGKKTVRMLCETFMKTPPGSVVVLEQRTGSTRVEAIKDYVSGMTDGGVMQSAARYS